MTSADSPTVFIVDDDAALLNSLEMLLKTTGARTATYSSPEAFLASYDGRPGCVVTDLRMPAMSGLDLQSKLATVKIPPPMIFLSAHADVPTAVRALKAGAFDFLEKPFQPQQLIDLINKAIERDRKSRAENEVRERAKERMSTLSRRELEVMELMALGLPNNEIAKRLSIARNTVENHRAKVFSKTGAESTVEIAKILDLARGSQIETGR